MNSHVKILSKMILFDLVGSVAWFPIWWYSRGLFGLIAWMKRELQYRVRAYAFAVWIKNFFVPMYGQHDWVGRIISIFMRFFVILGRLIALGIEIVLYGICIVLWAMAPIIAIAFFSMSFIRGAFFDQVRTLY